jgi:uncharacterized membrane protein YqaE (UPF0057 family)
MSTFLQLPPLHFVQQALHMGVHAHVRVGLSIVCGRNARTWRSSCSRWMAVVGYRSFHITLLSWPHPGSLTATRFTSVHPRWSLFTSHTLLRTSFRHLTMPPLSLWRSQGMGTLCMCYSILLTICRPYPNSGPCIHNHAFVLRTLQRSVTCAIPQCSSF